MDFVKLEVPTGPEWELLVAVVVVIVGPLLVERLRIPGLVGLLFGGMVVGPHVLDVIPSHTGVVAEIGTLGLLYLMFMAGLDLDLNVFAKVRRQAIVFALLTFAVPFTLGLSVGLAVDYELGAALLLGSVFASHTLVTYPLIRSFGLSTNRAVAITVGATIITDTLALTVLAIVSGQEAGDASGLALFSQIAIGLAIVCITCFVVLPAIARWFFATVGRGRIVRYTFAIADLLIGATVAGATGIEPIVGAFFAGLALNRLVPNESEMMEHIEFFGSALLIPIFLVSVGTVIDPANIVSPSTLALAGLFTLGCIGGKAIAIAIAHRAFHLTWDEVGVMFSLSVSQAAATLAATFVGLQLGLFNDSTVNAIMLVIVVSLIASSVTATHYGQRVPRPPVETERLGRSVLVYVDPATNGNVLPNLAARLARTDGGVVRPLHVVTPGTDPPSAADVRRIDHEIAGLRVDAELDVRHDRSREDGVVNACASFQSSLVMIPMPTTTTSLTGSTTDVISRVDVPVALARPSKVAPARVVLALSGAQATRPRSAVAASVSLVVRLVRSGLAGVVVCDIDLDPSLRPALGSLLVVTQPPPNWLAESAGPSDVVVVPGGRSGAGGSARAERRATERGATVLVVSDREALELTGDGFTGTALTAS